MSSKKKKKIVVTSFAHLACLVVEIIQHLIFLCLLTMTLHEAQGRRNEHEQMCHAYVYRHARFECHGLNTVRDMAIIVQVKQLSGLRRSCDLGEEQGHQTEKRISRLVVGLASLKTGWKLLEQFLK